MVYSTVSPTLQVRGWWNSKGPPAVWEQPQVQRRNMAAATSLHATHLLAVPQPHLQDALEENVTLNSPPSLVLLARFYVLWMTNLTKLNHISAPRRKQICPCNSPTVDTTQGPLIRQLDKPNVVYTHGEYHSALESERQLWLMLCGRTLRTLCWPGVSIIKVSCCVTWPRDLRTANITGDRAGQRLLEDTVRRDGSDCLIGTEFPNGTVKNFGCGQWWEPQRYCEYA